LYQFSNPRVSAGFYILIFVHCDLFGFCFFGFGASFDVLYVLQVLFPMRVPLSHRLMLCDAMRITQGETELRPITKAGGFLFYRDAKADYFSTLQGNGQTTRTGRKTVLATSIVAFYRTHRFDSVSKTSYYSHIAISI
jgi:hypothetical protein